MASQKTVYTLRAGNHLNREFHVMRFNTVKPLNLARANIHMFRKGRENLPPEEKKQPFSHLTQKKKEQFLRQGKAVPWILQDETKKIDFTGTHEAGVSDSRYVFLVKDADDTLTVYPCTDWYVFQPSVANQSVIPYEEAEKILQSKNRWEAKAAVLSRKKSSAEEDDDEKGVSASSLSIYGYAVEDDEELEAERRRMEEEKGEQFDFDHVEDDDNKEERELVHAIDEEEEEEKFQDEEIKTLKKLDKDAIGLDELDLLEEEAEELEQEDTEARGKKRKAETEATNVAKKPKLMETTETSSVTAAPAPAPAEPSALEKQLADEIKKHLLVKRMTLKELLSKLKPWSKEPNFKETFRSVISKRAEAEKVDGTILLKLKDDNFW